MNMKFVKGLVVGGLITTSVMMIWNDNNMSTKKVAKTGKKWAKKMGIMYKNQEEINSNKSS
ncbi:MAG: hypothetical protein V8R51_08650 [Clostridia bacterium]